MNNILSIIPASSFVLPVPYFVVVSLLVFTFFIHILFVNLTLGGSLLILVSRYAGKYAKDNNYFDIAEQLGAVNTVNISLAITTGVAPLLFVQVIYSSFFYSSSVLLSWYWLFVVFAVMIAYYAYYLFKFKPLYIKYLSSRGSLFILIATVLFLYVALMLVTNTLLSLQPEVWKGIYTRSDSIFSAKTLLPRYLHFILASIAFTGIFLMVYSRLRKKLKTELKDKMYDFGKKAFVIPTLAQFIVGPWFLFSHDGSITQLFLGKDIIASFFLLAGIIVSIIMLFLVYFRKESILNTTILIITLIFFMTIVRRYVETAFLDKYFDPQSLVTSSQWGAFTLFGVLLILLIISISYMLLKVVKEMK